MGNTGYIQPRFTRTTRGGSRKVWQDFWGRW